METFCAAKDLRENPGFAQKKQRSLRELDPGILDPEMKDLVVACNQIPHCYTLQSCSGHIVIPRDAPPEDWQRLPVTEPPGKAMYQLAYLALVVRDDADGRGLLDGLAAIATTNPDFIQMGSADWFWKEQGQVNSYVLQVSPQRFQHQDHFEMQCEEAFLWLAARGEFMAGLGDLLSN